MARKIKTISPAQASRRRKGGSSGSQQGNPPFQVHVLGRRDYNVDMIWPAERVIVEVDSYEWHLRKATFASDRARDADLEANGFTVLRFTAVQVDTEPFVVIARIAATLAWASARAA